MDEREELKIEAPVRAQLRRELDSIEIGPLSHYAERAQHARRSGVGTIGLLIVNAGVAVAVLVTAVVVGSVVGDRRAVPASPSGSLPPFGVSSDHGLIVSTRDGFVIRSETDPAVIRKIEPTRPLSEHTIAVSRDGRLVAYWRPPESRDQTGDELMLYDAANNADPRVLLQLANGQLGGAMVWADDGSGIAFTSQLIRSPAPGPVKRLQIIELKGGLSSGQPKEIATASGANVLRPLAWIRETRTVSAVEGSVDGFASNYVLASEDGEVSRVALRSGDQVVLSDSVVADAQSRFLTYIVTFTCQDGTPGCTLVRLWALEDPKIAIGVQALPGTTYVRAVWRPFSREVAVLVRRGGESHVELVQIGRFSPDRSIGPVPADSQILMRPDGRAFVSGRPGTGGLSGVIYDVATGSSLPIDLSGADAGPLTRSITIGTQEADRIARLATASPLLTDADAIERVRATFGVDRVDRINAILERGSFPLGGVMPRWKVRADGEFQQQGFRGGPAGAPPVARCGVWTFNARTGLLTGVRMSATLDDCAAF